MGGYQSRVPEHAPKSNFSSDPKGVPAKVMVSPELLRQLQHEHEERMRMQQQQRRIPLQFNVTEDQDRVERERLARIEQERKILASRAEERAIARKAEDAAIKNAKEMLERVEQRSAGPNSKAPKDNADVCKDEAAQLTKLMDSDKLEALFSELNVYETCIKRATASASSSSAQTAPAVAAAS